MESFQLTLPLRYALFLALLILFSITSEGESRLFGFSHPSFPSSFSFPNPKYCNMSEITVLGEAHVVQEPFWKFWKSHLRLSGASPRSFGRVMYSNPIKPSSSFSTYFSFSVSPGDGDGLAFVILPRDFPSGGRAFGLGIAEDSISRVPDMFAVEFDSSMDPAAHDINGNHVGIDVESLISSKVADLSDIGMVLNDGTVFHAWIDYDDVSHVLEVRLSKSGFIRPFSPLISHTVDLSSICKNNVYYYAGISSSSGSFPSQKSAVYSWNFRSYNRRQHSIPVNPTEVTNAHRTSTQEMVDELLGLLVSVLIGLGCGAASALAMLMVWSLFTNRSGRLPSKAFGISPVNFGYEKISGKSNDYDTGKKSSQKQ
eukprot:TRINITY_DN410_c0_g1_i1.p1 TRINITY_DN410_c0_g1~~TRINITY_DN410_c0_g1_i1.p1  ORF type:complete len:370 (-),score=22.88 TRINITY_DN410_c0_g1_i1:291-1400(-)